MKNRTLLCALALVLTITATAQKSGTPFNYSKKPSSYLCDAERLKYIDTLLQDYVDRGLLPHALTFVAKSGEVIHNKAYGYADLESKTPLQTDHIFRNFSQTKAIISVALMTLFEKGKFQIDDPVSRYIPECTDQVIDSIRPDGTYTTRRVSSPLRIRHLLSHTSGILGHRALGAARSKMMQERNGQPYKTLGEEVRDIIKLPLAFEPGTQWNYHPSIDVVGYLVEVFSGKPMRDYVKETIFTPLGMKDSDWYYPESYRSRFVTTYRERDGKLTPQPNSWSGRDPFSQDTLYCQAGTGLNGTIEDYARFCQMILNDGEYSSKLFSGYKQVLSKRTIKMMSKDQLPHPNAGGADFHFGLGFEIMPEKPIERRAIANFTPMVSPGSLHWGGAHNTDYLIDPQEDLVIILYTNRTPDTGIWEKFLNTVYQALHTRY